MSYTIRVGGDDSEARLINQAQRAQRMNHGIFTCVCVCICVFRTATIKRTELAPLSALGHSTRQILIFRTTTIKRPEPAPLSTLGHSKVQK